jgi:hypothetical protein
VGKRGVLDNAQILPHCIVVNISCGNGKLFLVDDDLGEEEEVGLDETGCNWFKHNFR